MNLKNKLIDYCRSNAELIESAYFSESSKEALIFPENHDFFTLQSIVNGFFPELKLVIGNTSNKRKHLIKNYMQIYPEKREIAPISLITFSLDNLAKKKRPLFYQAMFGYRQKKKYKGKLKEYHSKGLLKKVSGEKLSKNVIEVPLEKEQEIKKLFDKFKIRSRSRIFWNDDIAKLKQVQLLTIYNKKLSQSKKVRLLQRLKGYSQKDSYHKKGVIEELSITALNNYVLLLNEHQSESVVALLKELNCDYVTRRLWY